ncbi:MAG: hypothetical protein KJ060_07755 [Candidatus Hydrogenedentes bacterium]|nr:hypothetical protein [Candidatus Hydrogenedentota bacterium]
MALLIATIFVAIAILMLSALSVRVIQQNNQSLQYKLYNDAFTGLESALAESWVELETGQDGMVGLGVWSPPVGSTGRVLPSFDDSGVLPEMSSTQPTVQYMAYADDWSSNGEDDDGDGTIDDTGENFTYTVYAFSRNRGIQRNVEVVLKGFDVNVWRNAIFAGNGQAGGLINGNVSIHGSVHLLGSNVVNGNTVLSAIDLSGTSLIHNNYVGIPADLAARIPALDTVLFDGEMVQTLEAKLRVKNGLVGMSGNSEIGEPNISGNTIKETMDGTYVSDGWTGTSVNDDGGRGDPTNVWSDNGWDDSYDLGDKVPMPFLADDYRELGTGNTYINPSTLTNYTHGEYFEQVLAGTPYTGNMTIQANQNFYYNATRPSETNPAGRLGTDDYIYFDAATNRMEINGQIQINGDLVITRGGGNDKSIDYTGRAALLVKGNVTLDTDLRSMNANGTTANSFPAANILGIMAEQNLTVGSLSQLTLMGAFYAQGTVKSTKQTTTIGTLVGSYFDMGTNVPEIYQVPSLADNLPLGMIGAYPILVYDQVAWREIGT